MKKLSDLPNPIKPSRAYRLARENDENNYAFPWKNLTKYIPAVVHPKTIPFERLPLALSHNRSFKRGADILLSFFVITSILSWLVPVIALIIKIDSKGPVFFLQKRNKRNGKVFTCIKFRSMIVNKDADLVQSKGNDKRITRFGKYLRKKHLDELPQFFNVLLGDMSIVGPRPHMISDNLRYDKCVDHYANRLSVKPGITGLAQVMGYTGPVEDIGEMKSRVRIDNYYIRHWCLKLDAIILYITIVKAIL